MHTGERPVTRGPHSPDGFRRCCRYWQILLKQSGSTSARSTNPAMFSEWERPGAMSSIRLLLDHYVLVVGVVAFRPRVPGTASPLPSAEAKDAGPHPLWHVRSGEVPDSPFTFSAPMPHARERSP